MRIQYSPIFFLLLIGNMVNAQITLETDRVGINSENPTATLEVHDPSNFTEVLIQNANASRLTVDGGSPSIQWNVAGSRKAYANWGNDALRIYSSPPSPPPFSFSTPTLNLTEDRKVGINMGLVGNPTEALDVNGRIKVGNSADTSVAAGTIRWNSVEEDFEGFDGQEWRSLTKNNASWGTSIQFENELIIADDPQESSAYGWSVDIDGDYIVVGAFGDDEEAPGAGAAYILHLDNGDWIEQAKLTASDADSFFFFGYSVSIDGDYVVIGSYGNDQAGEDSGAAYIFKRTGSNWSEQAMLTASDGSAEDLFGRSVAIAGDYAVVGASGNDAEKGAAYIFQRFGTNWVQQKKLTASDKADDDLLGYSVAIDDGYAIAGTPGDDTLSGAAYVFQGSGSIWSQQAKLTDTDGSILDRLGWSVAIDGEHALIGSPYSGSVEGSAIVFHRSGSSWSQTKTLVSNDPAPGDGFGWSVALNDQYAIVGAVEDSYGANDSGASYIFRKQGSEWNQELKLSTEKPEADDQKGASVSLSANYAIVGANGRNYQGINSVGAIYIYEKQ